jgi:hypothetical protein
VNEPVLETLVKISFNTSEILLLVSCFILMIINWGLESKKWQLLVKSFHPLTYSKAYLSVLAGLSTGLLTPNRIGNFIGRLTFINYKDQNKAFINTVVGNLAQFVITLIFGSLCLIYILQLKFQIEHGLIISIISVLLTFLGIFLFFSPKSVLFYPISKWLSEKTKNNINSASDQSNELKFKILFVSFFRYLTFTTQYFILFKVFKVSVVPAQLIGLIGTVYLITTIVPSLFFGKLFIRESVALIIFSLAGISSTIILIVAFILWFINLAIPASVGSIIWLKQKNV